MNRGISFLAHCNDVSEGLKKPLIQYDKRKSLANNEGRFFLINNICPHQGSLILDKMSKDLRCQYHSWSWDDQGKPLSSGNTKLCNRTNIPFRQVHESQRLVFSENINLSKISSVNLSYMILQEERIDRVKSNYKNIVDVFLDVDHIPIVHAKVYESMGINGGAEVDWIYTDWGSFQLVSKTGVYSKEYSQTLLNIDEEQLAAFWITIYPGTMIEWQPGAMFVTVCIPRDSYTDVCVYKYRDSRYCEQNWKLNSYIWETAWFQDKHQSESIIQISEFEPHLEESKLHFRKWLGDQEL